MNTKVFSMASLVNTICSLEEEYTSIKNSKYKNYYRFGGCYVRDNPVSRRLSNIVLSVRKFKHRLNRCV